MRRAGAVRWGRGGGAGPGRGGRAPAPRPPGNSGGASPGPGDGECGGRPGETSPTHTRGARGRREGWAAGDAPREAGAPAGTDAVLDGGSSVSLPAAARTAVGSPALEGVPQRAVPLPFPVPRVLKPCRAAGRDLRGIPSPLLGGLRAPLGSSQLRAGGREMRSGDICRRGWEILISLVRFACG